jgi:hypothetical protein
MRIYPPSTALFTRVARRNVVIDGTPVAEGTLAVILIWQMHRDPRWFPDPECYRPERFMPGAPPIPRGAFMPFGAGHIFVWANISPVSRSHWSPPRSFSRLQRPSLKGRNDLILCA